LARYERDFHADASEPLTLHELVALLGNEGDAQSRDDAIACYLSGDDGWRDAVKRLGGAFAPNGSGLSDGKTE
jgi:type IV secretory pathway VirJ component